MNTDKVVRDPARDDEAKKPVFGVLSLVLSLLGILIPLLASSNLGGDIDTYVRHVIPWATYGLAAIAFFRRERAIWAILGVVFSSLYIGLHLAAIP